MLKKVISVCLIISSIFILLYDKNEVIIQKEKIDNIIDKKINNKYDGYIYFPRLNYKNVISTQDDSLDKNIVKMISRKEVVSKDVGNIILAGHNNKYVFSNLYKLNENDEIIISDFNKKYSYTVQKKEYINIKNTDILDNIYNSKILTLITCTNNNQIRYVITAKYNHIISHN